MWLTLKIFSVKKIQEITTNLAKKLSVKNIGVKKLKHSSKLMWLTQYIPYLMRAQ